MTPLELERGQAFSAWLSRAITAAGTNTHQLSLKPGMPSSTYLYWLLDNGISNTGEYKRPSEDMVRQIATELRADVADGLRAAGYSTSEMPQVLSELADLPMDIQHDLADIARKIRYSLVKEMDIRIATASTPRRTSFAEPSVIREPGPLYPITNALPPGLVRLPVLGFAGAVGESFNIFAEEHQESDLALPASLVKNNDPERCFIVRVRGNCLMGSLIADGDFAVCVATDVAKDGDIVLVADGDDAILKRFRESVGDEGCYRWLETDEASGEQHVHQTEYPPRILGRMIALHREM